MRYEIHKGVDKPIEFHGLQAQYLYIFGGGLLAIFLLFVILYVAGAGQWFCVSFGLLAAVALVFFVFRLNARYGRYGLMKKAAARWRPRRITNRKSVTYLIYLKKHD